MDEIHKALRLAKEAEARARYLEVNGIISNLPCGLASANAKCRDCAHFTACENIPYLFQKAWQGYLNAETDAREYMAKTDSEESIALLAQILLDIHIHPNSGLKRDTPELWESQYLWLKLYYRTKNEAYMHRAKLCEDIRNACVVKIT